jgi:folate-binding protein YgfZ
MARPPRDVVVVSGADAISFLQSLLSQDLDPLGDGHGAHTLLLTPQGKLDVDLVYLRVGDEAWLLCEGGYGEQLAASLARFKIRVDATIEPRPDLTVLAVRGPSNLAAELDGAAYAHARRDGGRVVRVPWPGGDAVDVVGPAEAVDAVEERLRAAGVERIDDAAYDALRIAAGVPRQGFDTDEKTIPQEAFLEHDAVSFTKGCFLGQELVCRIDTRGHVNRYLRTLRLGDVMPPRGSEVVADDKVVGTVTSSVDSPTAASSVLGYVRHEIEPGARVIVRWDGGDTEAVVEELATR